MFYENHPVNADFFRAQTDINVAWPDHLHQCFEFVTVIRGKVDITVDRVRYSLSVGDSLLIFPYQIHSLKTSDNSCHHLWLFSPQMVQGYSTRVGNRLPVSNCFRPPSSVVKLLYSQPVLDNLFACKGVLYTLCGLFDRTAEYRERNMGPENLLCRIFVFAQKHFADGCSLADLAKDTAYDYAYLSRFFKRTVGMSYTEYINRFRIHSACHLLTNSDRPVSKIAYEVGFHSLRSFNRNFKELMGSAPGEYRKREG